MPKIIVELRKTDGRPVVGRERRCSRVIEAGYSLGRATVELLTIMTMSIETLC